MGDEDAVLQLIPEDKTGNFIKIYDFLREHWEIIRWVALGIVILEVWLVVICCVCEREKCGERGRERERDWQIRASVCIRERERGGEEKFS